MHTKPRTLAHDIELIVPLWLWQKLHVAIGVVASIALVNLETVHTVNIFTIPLQYSSIATGRINT